MKTSIKVSTILLAAGFATSPVLAQVTLPEDREAFLESARLIVEPERKRLDEMVDGMVLHPFHPRMDAVVEGSAPAVGLARITQNLAPTGTISMGGNTFLLFNGRRVGVGEYLSVEFQGRTYQVEVARISGSTYTLRMNDEEIDKNL